MKYLTYLAALVFASALAAQVQDDRDIAIDPLGKGSHGLRMAHTDDGQIVAAWVVHGAGRHKGSDELVVGVSQDGGNSWRLLWNGRSSLTHTYRIADMSIAVAPVVGRGASADPRIYIAAEFVVHAPDMRTPLRRFLRCISGPLNRVWSGNHLGGVHVHGQMTHEASVSIFMDSTRPSIGLPVYKEGGRLKHMVVVAYRWWDGPSRGLYLATPFRGDLGRMRNGRTVWLDMLSRDGAYPSLTTDPNGATFTVAHEEGSDVVLHNIDTSLFRQGMTGLLSTDKIGADIQRPHIAMNNSKIVLTALDNRRNLDGSRALRWYRKQGSAPWSSEGILHSSAFSPAPIVTGESRMFAAAFCLVDRGAPALTAFTTSIGSVFPAVQMTRVGDRSGRDGLPTLALSGRTDACAYGYGDDDVWWHGGPFSEVYVDPAQ